jgi:hypothetical protein
LAYIAPEVLRGRAVDHRADLFSVGVMLWELVADRRLWVPKSADGNAAWCLAPGASPPELPAALDIPPELRTICRRALAIDPDARYESAAELGAALERLGAHVSDSHARHLGQLVSSAFEPEIKARRALLEVRLRPSSEMPAVAVVEEKPTDELPAPPAPLLPAAVKRGHAWSRTVLVSATVAMIALLSGALLGGRGAGLAMRRATAPAPHRAPPVSTPVTRPEPPIEFLPPREATLEASPRVANRERRAHLLRARALKRASDDVLDIDGSPLPPARGSGVWGAWTN